MTDSIPELTTRQRWHVLAAAFLAWMFAGLGIALFILVHRQMMLELLGGNDEKAITRWFAWFQAAFLFGAAVGGWLFGWLGDRIGRTRAMGLSVMWCSLFTLAGYPADSPELLMALRFTACMGIGGVWPNAVALVAEVWPDASRPFLAGLLGAAANFGQVLMGVIGYYFEITPSSWRWTLLVGALPAFFGIWILTFIPESVRWLAARAKQPATDRQSPIREVLRPPLLYRVMLGIGLGAIPVVGTAANGNWLVPWTDHVAEQQAKAAVERGDLVKKKTADPRNKARTQITRSTGGIFGSLIGGLIASLLGRRLSYFLISLSAMIASTYIFTQLDPLHSQFQLFTLSASSSSVGCRCFCPNCFRRACAPRAPASLLTRGASWRGWSSFRRASFSICSAATTPASDSGAVRSTPWV
jgi:predicted MFS family arabinose efflux permease